MAMSGYPPAPAGVSNNAAQQRGWGPGYPNCQTSKIRRIEFSNGVVIHVRGEIAELVTILINECIRRGYVVRQKDTGGFNCRAIAGTTVPSNHSWGLAIDVNWNSNPMGQQRTDIPVWMVQLFWLFHFFWGGWYSGSSIDTMHFEYVGTPSQALADTARARELYGGTDVALSASEQAQLFNAASAAGNLGLMHDEAPHKVWQGPRAGDPAEPLQLKLPRVLRTIAADVATIKRQTEPVELPPVEVGEFTLADADVERIATRVAELLAERLAD